MWCIVSGESLLTQSPLQTVLPKSDQADLLSLVQAQQTRLQSQQAEIKHVSILLLSSLLTFIFQCENELRYWDGAAGPAPARPNQLEALMVEVKMLEEAAIKNEEEIQGHEEVERGGGGVRGELDQLKHRLGKRVE